MYYEIIYVRSENIPGIPGTIIAGGIGAGGITGIGPGIGAAIGPIGGGPITGMRCPGIPGLGGPLKII